jgi:hypothetical protein
MEECITLNGGCDWTISNWARKSVVSEENLPLWLTGKKKTEKKERKKKFIFFNSNSMVNSIFFVLSEFKI